MNWLRAGIIMILSVVALLYFTRPSREDVEEYVHAIALSQVQAKDLELSENAARNTLLQTCREKPETCTDAFRKIIRIEYRPRVIYADVVIRGLGTENHCYALFNQLTCTETR